LQDLTPVLVIYRGGGTNPGSLNYGPKGELSSWDLPSNPIAWEMNVFRPSGQFIGLSVAKLVEDGATVKPTDPVTGQIVPLGLNKGHFDIFNATQQMIKDAKIKALSGTFPKIPPIP
jgi:hypothetical protein